MRSRRARRSLAAAALSAVAALVFAPGVAAQTEPTQPTQPTEPDPWEGSAIQSPGSSMDSSDVLLAGVFKHSAGHIQAVRLDIGRPAGGGFDDADADTCVPADPGQVRDLDGNTDVPNQSYSFARTPMFRCNGSFALRATPDVAFEVDEPPLVRAFDVAVPPHPVPSMTAALDEGNQPSAKTGATADDPAAVTVSWERIDGSQYPDFVGYRVMRTGPGDQGTVDVSGTLGSDAGAFTDQVEAPGRYSYSVQSLRSGPNGDVPSGTGTPSAEVRVAGPAASSTTAPPGDGDGNGNGDGTESRSGSSLIIPGTRGGADIPGNQRRSRITAPRNTGTIDTGFEQELDYGDRSEPGDEQALAGEGQSVIRTDENGPGLLGPAAGALVLLGWAGHVAYLNRLAKQF